MIREDRFKISQRPYAVDLSSLAVGPVEQGADRLYCYAAMRAVWFRRRRGVTCVSIGELRDSQAPPADAVEFLRSYGDGCYGGRCAARWDGRAYWSEHPGTPEAMQTNMAILRPALEGYPNVPDGFDGWWRF